MYCIKVYRSLSSGLRTASLFSRIASDASRLQRSIYQRNYSDSGARPRLPDSPLSGETALHFSTFGRSKYLAACVLSCEATHLIVLINSSAPPTAVDTCCVLLIYGSTVYTIYSSGLYCESSLYFADWRPQSSLPDA